MKASQSKIARIETGEVSLTYPDLRILLEIYGVRDTTTIEEMSLWRR